MAAAGAISEGNTIYVHLGGSDLTLEKVASHDAFIYPLVSQVHTFYPPPSSIRARFRNFYLLSYMYVHYPTNNLVKFIQYSNGSHIFSCALYTNDTIEFILALVFFYMGFYKILGIYVSIFLWFFYRAPQPAHTQKLTPPLPPPPLLSFIFVLVFLVGVGGVEGVVGTVITLSFNIFYFVVGACC